MAATETWAYITTVPEDHRVIVPADLPTGTTVAIVAVPVSSEDAAARRARFDATLEAIRNAMQHPVSGATLTDEQIDAVIERARKRDRA